MPTTEHPPGVFLEPVSRKRKAEFIRLAKASKAFHKKWVIAPSTDPQFEAFVKRARNPANRSFFLCGAADCGLAGVFNISQIFLGFFRSAYLGYYVFKPFARDGLMTEGLRLVLAEAFGTLELHRLEANIRPQNLASRKLVRRLGFRLEGYSPRYLMVDGKWRDHERWAITREDWEKHGRSARLLKDGGRFGKKRK